MVTIGSSPSPYHFSLDDVDPHLNIARNWRREVFDLSNINSDHEFHPILNTPFNGPIFCTSFTINHCFLGVSNTGKGLVRSLISHPDRLLNLSCSMFHWHRSVQRKSTGEDTNIKSLYKSNSIITLW